MASEVANIVIGEATKPLIDYVKDQIDYAWNCIDYTDNLKHELENLKGAKSKVEHLKDEAERGVQTIESPVHRWLGKAEKFIVEADEFLKHENKAKEKCFMGLCHPWKTRYQRGRKAKEMLPAADNLKKEKKDILRHGVSYHERPKGIEPVKDFKSFDSRKSIFKEIMLALKDSDVTKIGVYGLDGVGKTTMVKEIATRAKEKNLFQDVLMATVFEEQNLKEMQGEEVVKLEPDLQRIQGEIKDGLGYQFRSESVKGRADELRELLKNEKRKKLVVLDDIWAGLKLDDVGIPSDHQGCKILMTSTNENVLKDMGSKENFLLDVLPRHEARSWFKEMVGDFVKDPPFLTVANKVADKCERLPFFLVNTASGLKGQKELSAWDKTLNKMSRSDKKKEFADSILRSNFKLLKGGEIQSLFLLCGQLQPSFIPVSSLLRYSKGLGLFENCNTLKDTRDTLLSYVDDLKASSWLLELNTPESLKMRKIVHNFAVSESKRNNVFTVSYGEEIHEWPDDNALKQYTAFSLPYCKIPELPDSIACPKLNSLLLYSKDSSLKVPDNFFKSMKKLRVLDLTKIHFSSLPSSLQFLNNLRTLCLDQCNLEDIPNMAIIGKLKNLEILSFCFSDIVELPREIAQLSCLQLLDLSNCRRLEVIPPNVLSCLTQLEDLHMENICLKWGFEGKNASLAELELLPNLNCLDVHITDPTMVSTGLFSKRLERFRIFIGEGWDWSDKNEMLKTLKLKLNTDILSQYGIRVLLKETEVLCLEDVNGVQKSLCEFDGQGFPLLKHLQVGNSHGIQYIINSVRSAAFTRLESLCLDNLKNLKKIYDGKLMAESFGNLRVLKVGSCDTLKNLFSTLLARGLLRLEEINIKNCKIMEEIVMEESEDDSHETIKLPQLHSLTLESLPQFTSFCSMVKAPSMSHTKQKLLESDGSAKEIMSENEMETPTPLFSKKVFCPNLKTLNLSSINIMRIWHDQVVEASSYFENLTSLIVGDCSNLKHLLSSSMVESLSNLKSLRVYNCRMLEQILVTEGLELKTILKDLESLDLEDLPKLTHFCGCELLECPALRDLSIENCPKLRTFVSNPFKENMAASSEAEIINFVLFDEKVAFPNLDYLSISKMDSVKMIWHNELHEDSFCKLKWLSIGPAEELLNVLPSSHVLSRFKNLEFLYVNDCDSLKEVFDVRELINAKEMHTMITTSLRILLLSGLPNLKHIWSKDALECLSFQNLCGLKASNCPNLKSLFPASMVKGLMQLQSLGVHACGVEEIISKEEGVEAVDRFEFPKLTYLELQKLPHLKRFYPGKHTIEWPALENLEVCDCNKIAIFASESLNSKEVCCEDQPESPVQQPLFTAEKVIPNLEGLPLNSKDAKMIQNGQFSASLFHKVKRLTLQSFHEKFAVFPFDLIENFGHLASLVLRNSCFREVFPHGLTGMENQRRTLSQIQDLMLDSLHNLEHIHLDHVIENLKTLVVQSCSSLISLAPSSASFQNLTSLSVRNCERLVHLMTLSTAQSLVHLIEINITECNMMTEVIANGGGEVQDEITFHKLETLELTGLTNLNSFCSANCTLKFPSLEDATVRQCPKMSIFSKGVLHVPKLRKVLTEGWKDSWLEDLNTTVHNLYAELAGFNGLQQLKLSEFPELKGRWPDQIPVNFFSNLRSLVVDGCSNFWSAIPSSLLPFLNVLETLEVRSCDSVEEVFDKEQPNLGDVGYLRKLNNFHLIGLPRLRRVCHENPRGNLDYRNVKVLKVHDCGSLRYIFTPTIILGLVRLQEIEVKNCPEIEEIITKGAAQDEIIYKITFPLLNTITLESLPKLTSFYSGSGIVECLSVKKIAVVDCPNTFTYAFLRGQEPSAPYETTEPKVAFPKLENLRVEWNDIMEKFWHGQFEAEFFCKLKNFEFVRCPNNYASFPPHFLQRLPSLENLAVSDAFFEEIVLHGVMNDEETHLGILSQLRELKLFKLPSLMLLVKEDSESSLVLQNLETLEVIECCRMKILAPSSVSFCRLKSLVVSKCRGLINLITSSTAKSLAQLTTMNVTECAMIKVIVANEESETEEEVVFGKLECLRLDCLPNLTSFYNGNCKFMFPSLEEVQVRECPKMSFFSHGVVSMPKLNKLELTEGEDKGCWEGNINAPIQQLFVEMGKAAAQSKPPSSPRQTNLNFGRAQVEENNKLAVSVGQASEEVHASENPEAGNALPTKVEMTKTSREQTYDFSWRPTLETPSTQATGISSLSPVNFESLFARVEELLKPSQESSSQPESRSTSRAEFLKSNSGSSENYGYFMDLMKKILKKNLIEVASSADALLLLTSLKNLKNFPHLNSEQLEIIEEYIENFDSLVTYHPNYEQQIEMSSALKFSIEDNKKGMAELKTLYNDFSSTTSSLSASKEALKKKLQEIEEKENHIRANMEVLYSKLVTRKGELEININVLPEAVRQQKVAEDNAKKANHSWARLRSLFP